jgi:hypothetical protein
MIALSLIFAIGMIGSFVTLTEIANAAVDSKAILRVAFDPSYSPGSHIGYEPYCNKYSC